MSIAILQETTENYQRFQQFKQGDEQALAYIHKYTSKPLYYHAKKYIEDSFAINTLVQDAYMQAWKMRARFQSMWHLYRFMRINVYWGCMRWLKSPGLKFYRQNIYSTDQVENYETWQYSASQEMEQQARSFDEDRMQLIDKVIPYLAPMRQTMIDLYFKRGLTYKHIARRFGTTHISVHNEVQKGLTHLKSIIQRRKKAAVPVKPSEITLGATPDNGLDAEMMQIYHLRHDYKMGFAVISEKLNQDQGYIQRKYIEAHALIAKQQSNN